MNEQFAGKVLAAHRVTWFGPQRPTGNTVFVKRPREQAGGTAERDHEASARSSQPNPDA